MDPDVTFETLIDALRRRDYQRAGDCLAALNSWCAMGGFPPACGWPAIRVLARNFSEVNA